MSGFDNSPAVLVLEDGRVFRGTTFGAVGQTLGEAVFSTGMTGYQETLTDPSYHRQIVVSTAPQIGNTGWNDEDDESVGPTGERAGAKIWVAGYVVRDPSRVTSSWRATGSLQAKLEEQGIVGIAGIDTRALVRHLRTRGSMKAGIFSGEAIAADDELVRRVQDQPTMLGADLAGEVQHHQRLRRRAEGRGGAVHGCRHRPRYQDQHPAHVRRARYPRPRVAVQRESRTDPRPEGRRSVPLQRSR